MQHVATKKELASELGRARGALEKALFAVEDAQRRVMKPGLPDVEYQLHDAVLALSRARLILYRRAQKKGKRCRRAKPFAR